jgi:ribosomal protein S18 acetylase RimI-like enzyme
MPSQSSCRRKLPPIRLVPASHYTIDELVAAYNQSRVDYIVPMPMNAARLHEYVSNYDVDLEASAVAVADDEIVGIGMLGVRPNRTWITRLGVLPVKRRHGIGQRLMEYLIEKSRHLDVPYIILEVIKDNTPAERLFHKLGFLSVRELLIIRRPPGSPTATVGPYEFQMLGNQWALKLLEQRRDNASWLTDTPSLNNAGNLSAMTVELRSGGRGWIAFQETTFQLRRLVLHTEQGDPHLVSLALLHALHTSHTNTDTAVENIAADSPHWPAMQEMGYVESFRRIEMQLDLD